MTQTTPSDLTDLEVVTAAEGLMRDTNVKDNLPPRHTLRDLWLAEKQMHSIAKRFMEKYGERLQGLDPLTYNGLQAWISIDF